MKLYSAGVSHWWGGDMGYYLLGGGFVSLSGARQAHVWVTLLVQSSCKANGPVVLC